MFNHIITVFLESNTAQLDQVISLYVYAITPYIEMFDTFLHCLAAYTNTNDDKYNSIVTVAITKVIIAILKEKYNFQILDKANTYILTCNNTNINTNTNNNNNINTHDNNSTNNANN